MAPFQSDRFVRLPTKLLEALLRARLNGTQWRILLWVVRYTYGWNRNASPFTWYRIAEDLSMDRGGVVRAGKELLRVGVPYATDGQLGIQIDHGRWADRVYPRRGGQAGQLLLTGISPDSPPRERRTANIATDDGRHLERCQQSSVFRRAKDSSKTD